MYSPWGCKEPDTTERMSTCQQQWGGRLLQRHLPPKKHQKVSKTVRTNFKDSGKKNERFAETNQMLSQGKKKNFKTCGQVESSLAIQWLRVGALIARGLGSILGWGTKIL